MSTQYHPIGYPDVPRNAVPVILAKIEEALRGADMIMGDHDPDAAYTDKGRTFRPGRASGVKTERFDLGNGNVHYTINGVVLKGPLYFNYGPFVDTPDFKCPACGAVSPHETDAANAMQERCFDRFQAYFEGDPSREVICLTCDEGSDVNVWFGPKEFILSDVAVEFWEWPFEAVDRAVAVIDKAVGAVARDGGGIKV